MAYQGGKRMNAEFIVDILNDELFDGMRYLEPFVGYAHILRRVTNKDAYIASDYHPLVMSLLNAVRRGRSIPRISRKEYYALKERTNVVSLKRATAAFTYSFNGKEWGGYVGKYSSCGIDRDPAAERRRYYDKLYENDTFQRAKLSQSGKDYKSHTPQQMLVYCDPPYADTEGYGGQAREKIEFDTQEFWKVMREWSKNNVVFVSEYKAPSDFVNIASQKKHMSFAAKGSESVRTERLFIHKSCKKHLKELANIQDVSLPKWVHRL
jgi:DNA adenine methylase